MKRNTHRNTSWDKAKFEVVGHKYADLSNHDYGVALLNDCKYGYMVLDNILDLNLLRSPSNPDPDADLGDHSFTYSLLPHKNDLIRSNVISEASCLNQKPLLFEGYSSDAKIPVKLWGQGIELTVLKKAEKEDVWIFRVVETDGRSSSGRLSFGGSIVECDLMEWNNISEKQTIKKESAKLGGEMSGHIFFNDKWYGFDDGIYVFLRFLEILSNEPDLINHLLDLPKTYATSEIDIAFHENNHFEFMERFIENNDFNDYRVSYLDGIKITDENSWGLIRASNTSPKITLRFEALSENSLINIKNEIKNAILKIDNTIELPF